MSEPAYTEFAVGIDGDGTHWAQCYDRGVRLRQYGITQEQACANLLLLIIDKDYKVAKAEQERRDDE